MWAAREFYNEKYAGDSARQKSVWSAAQSFIAECPPPPVGYKSAVKNPLAGLIVCGKCGHKMVIRKGYNKPDYIMCHYRHCDNVSAPLKYVEARVLDTLKKWVGEYKLEYAGTAARADADGLKAKALKSTRAELSALEGQLNAAYDLLERGIYTPEQFLVRSKNLSERIERAKSEVLKSEKDLSADFLREESRWAIIPKAEKLIESYDSMPSPAQKNTILKEVIEKAVYTKKQAAKKNASRPDDFEMVVFPKLPKCE
jgi:ssDNA-binding Zn-finger/Zn-ribbon topoisomerase 1